MAYYLYLRFPVCSNKTQYLRLWRLQLQLMLRLFAGAVVPAQTSILPETRHPRFPALLIRELHLDHQLSPTSQLTRVPRFPQPLPVSILTDIPNIISICPIPRLSITVFRADLIPGVPFPRLLFILFLSRNFPRRWNDFKRGWRYW